MLKNYVIMWRIIVFCIITLDLKSICNGFSENESIHAISNRHKHFSPCPTSVPEVTHISLPWVPLADQIFFHHRWKKWKKALRDFWWSFRFTKFSRLNSASKPQNSSTNSLFPFLWKSKNPRQFRKLFIFCGVESKMWRCVKKLF